MTVEVWIWSVIIRYYSDRSTQSSLQYLAVQYPSANWRITWYLIIWRHTYWYSVNSRHLRGKFSPPNQSNNSSPHPYKKLCQLRLYFSRSPSRCPPTPNRLHFPFNIRGCRINTVMMCWAAYRPCLSAINRTRELVAWFLNREYGWSWRCRCACSGLALTVLAIWRQVTNEVWLFSFTAWNVPNTAIIQVECHIGVVYSGIGTRYVVEC